MLENHTEKSRVHRPAMKLGLEVLRFVEIQTPMEVMGSYEWSWLQRAEEPWAKGMGDSS